MSAIAGREPILEDFYDNDFHPRRNILRGKGLAWLPVSGG